MYLARGWALLALVLMPGIAAVRGQVDTANAAAIGGFSGAIVQAGIILCHRMSLRPRAS